MAYRALVVAVVVVAGAAGFEECARQRRLAPDEPRTAVQRALPDVATTQLLADLSALVYEYKETPGFDFRALEGADEAEMLALFPDDANCRRVVAQLFDVVPRLRVELFVETGGGTEVAVFSSATLERVIVAFRGTSEFNDFLADAHVAKKGTFCTMSRWR